jgi:hypothetical protein
MRWLSKESQGRLKAAYEFAGPAFRKLVVPVLRLIQPIYEAGGLDVRIELEDHEDLLAEWSQMYIGLYTTANLPAHIAILEAFGHPVKKDQPWYLTDDPNRKAGIVGKLIVFSFNLCLNCGQPKTKHAKDQCLFQSTKFLPEIR